jgi:alkylated DNA repair dioxygenase AlkB
VRGELGLSRQESSQLDITNNIIGDRASSSALVEVPLDNASYVATGTLPGHLRLNESAFRALWALHPKEYHQIRMYGRMVATPRWQQAYGHDYRYTGNLNKALPVPTAIKPLVDWAQNSLEPRLNGILINWYDGSKGHYIGPHRDSPQGLIEGAPIVTISFGEERIFRFRPHDGKGKTDLPVGNGMIVVIPYETNRAWTHEVPKTTKLTGKRMSVTLRAFV